MADVIFESQDIRVVRDGEWYSVEQRQRDAMGESFWSPKWQHANCVTPNQKGTERILVAILNELATRHDCNGPL